MTATDFKKYLAKKGTRQQFVADNLGVSKALVSRWINGSAPIPTKHITAIQTLLK